MADTDIITANLERMRQAKRGGMQYVLTGQVAFGASVFYDHNCTLVQYFYDEADGRMLYFGMSGVPANIKEHYAGNLFIAVRSKSPATRIVKFNAPENASEHAKKNLEQTIDEYNLRYGFELVPDQF